MKSSLIQAKANVRCAIVQALASQVWHENNPGSYDALASDELGEDLVDEALIEFGQAYMESEAKAA